MNMSKRENRTTDLRLLIVTDAWEPQTNGVVTTLQAVMSHLPDRGISTTVIHPGMFKTWPLPSYPEIQLTRSYRSVWRALEAAQVDAIHIATEGPLGLIARRFCRQRGLAFTTSLHTKFPEYLHTRTRLPLSLGYRFIRWFHQPAAVTLVTTVSHQQELRSWGLDDLAVWSRGVDTELFQPQPRQYNAKPRLLYVGRIAVEKNLEAFLSLDLDCDKVIVGDGPARASLQARYPRESWLGYRKGQELSREYARADLFVFPSRTDTFGLVMLEAMACGTPVAAYPVTGPIDVVSNGTNGWLDEDLSTAIHNALRVDRFRTRQFALQYSWQAIADRLIENLFTTSSHKVTGAISGNTSQKSCCHW